MLQRFVTGIRKDHAEAKLREREPLVRELLRRVLPLFGHLEAIWRYCARLFRPCFRSLSPHRRVLSIAVAWMGQWCRRWRAIPALAGIRATKGSSLAARHHTWIHLFNESEIYG
jgi:hypothetical protein